MATQHPTTKLTSKISQIMLFSYCKLHAVDSIWSSPYFLFLKSNSKTWYATYLLDELGRHVHLIHIHIGDDELYASISWPVQWIYNWSLISYLTYIPTNMTYCSSTRASDLEEDEKLRAIRRYLKKLSRNGAFSMASVLVRFSCAGSCHLGWHECAR